MNKNIELPFLRCDKFIIDWTPKAGCTIAKKIWLDYMDTLDEALKIECYHSGVLLRGWVHDFMPIFFRRFGRVGTEVELKSDNFIKIKYVRNPWDRAVSSYIHACKYPGLFGDYEEINPSFYGFLEALITGELSMHGGGDHWRIQNLFPEVKYNEIIKIENLKPETKRLNKKYNLNLKWNFGSRHHVKKKNRINNFFNASASYVKKYLDEHNQVPAYSSFYDDQTIKMVYEIYKTDVNTYQYKYPYS